MKILIVDDSGEKTRSICSVIQGKYDESEVTIDSVLTIIEAKKKLKDKNVLYDLMILDLNLPLNFDSTPDLDTTLKFVKEINNQDNIYNLPRVSIGLTAYDELEIVAKQQFQRCAWTIIKYSDTEDSWKQTLSDILSYTEYLKPINTVDVCIVTALYDPEATTFMKYIDWEWSQQTPLGSRLFGYKGCFTDKEGHKRDVVLCAVSEKGMVHTSITTTKLIQLFSPKLMVMAGICAGIKDQSQYGDIVIAQSAWNYNEGKTERINGNIRFHPSPLHSNIKRVLSDNLQAFINNCMKSINQINTEFDDKDVINSALKISKGGIATGSAVLNDGQTILETYQKNKRLKGIDMEVSAFYVSCEAADYNNLDFFAVKSISDFGDGEKNDYYQEYASFTSAKFIEKYIKENHSFV
ncbi:hypothetical protein [Psychrobacter sp. UBA3480]|uniref:phosphorylase family protein n=1 Tax=Psychrobacter sp. UBA3480 TaxID=1947350 RepID=UPI0025D287B4|nr:hypothetical protein [Psychrobacter sp. UBA3480]